jgi:hypothetical protein
MSSAAMSSESHCPGGYGTDLNEMIDDPVEADISQAQRFLAIVSDEQGSGGHYARFAALGQRPETSVDNGMLQIRERGFRRRSGSRLGP